MNGVAVTALCVIAALACAVLRRDRPEMALALAAGAGILATAGALGDARNAIAGIRGLAAGEDSLPALGPLIRAGGICLLAELGMDLCEDAGEKALSGRIGLGARCTMLAMALPMLLELLTCVKELLS